MRGALERHVAIVERLTGLRVDPVPPVEYASRGQVLKAHFERSPFLWQQTDNPRQPAEIELFRTLGLLPPDFRLDAESRLGHLRDLGGCYDPKSGRILLVLRPRREGDAEIPLHELVHAAQDQLETATGEPLALLDMLWDSPHNRDQALALLSGASRAQPEAAAGAEGLDPSPLVIEGERRLLLGPPDASLRAREAMAELEAAGSLRGWAEARGPT